MSMSLSAAPSRMAAARSHKYTEWKKYMPTDFPIGIRALLVDDDRVCLAIMKQMLTKAQYEVTACYKATEALSLLREKKESFDIIISDVHMPGMDGFELLRRASLETDHPFILISVDARINVMMRGYSLGATDYLIKPLRIEDLGHVWKHIAKTRLNFNEAPKCIKHNTLTIEEPTSSSNSKKRKAAAKVNDDGNDDNSGDESKKDDSSSSKRTYLMWTTELHHKFLSAVNQIGVDRAVPKQILELMNVPGITRRNVASHLQKYRLRLRKFGHLCSGVAARTGQRESLNFPALCAPGQMPAQTLASSEQEMLCRPSGSLSVPPMGHLNLQHASMQSQPLMDCQTNMCNISPHWKVAGSYNSSHRANNMQISHVPISSNRNSWYNNANTISGHQQLGIGRRTDENFSNVGVFNGSRISGSTSSSVLPCEVGSMPHPWIVSGAFPGQEPEESFGLLDTDPNNYLVDDIESLTINFG